MTHEHLGFQLFHGFKRYTHDNQNGCTSQREAAHSGQRSIHNRKQGDQRQEQCTDQSNLGKDFGNKIDVGLPGRIPGIVPCSDGDYGHFHRIILDRKIEICEHDDQKEVQHTVKPAIG